MLLIRPHAKVLELKTQSLEDGLIAKSLSRAAVYRI